MPRLLPVRVPFLRAVSPSNRIRYSKVNEGHSPILPAPESFNLEDPGHQPRKSRLLSTPILTLLFILVFALGFLSGKTPHYLRKGTGVLEADDPYDRDSSSKQPIITAGKHPHESHPKPGPQGDVHKAIVIASFREQDISWLNETPSAWVPYRYMLDDPNPDPEVGLPVPRNYGREAMAYLTFIIDNYHKLPRYTIFTHGHYNSWHQVEPLPWKIRAMNLTALDQENYINLRCGDELGCKPFPYLDTQVYENMNWDGELHTRRFWDLIMPNQPLPRYVSYKCCAQHAVTDDAIRLLSLEDWERIRAPLLRDAEDYPDMVEGPEQSHLNPWVAGNILEKFWHIFFGKPAEFCPDADFCRNVHFSNAIICDRNTDLHILESEGWQDTKCASPFENVGKDEEPNWDEWYAKLPETKERLAREKEAAEKSQGSQAAADAIKGAQASSPDNDINKEAEHKDDQDQHR